MGLLIKGISRLSELAIDADKDWNGKGIASLRQLAAAMARGDLVVRGDSVLVRLQPGSTGLVLTSSGPLHLPAWAPAGGNLKYYFPYSVGLSHAEAKAAVSKLASVGAAISSPCVATYLDGPAQGIRRQDPAVTLAAAGAVVAADRTVSEGPAVGRQGGVKMLLDGAVADDGGALTDETAAAGSATASDMTLLPALPAVNDAYYFGSRYRFDWLWLNTGIAGVGNWSTLGEYWNGSAWVPVVDGVDGTSQFMASGLKRFSHTPQPDWSTTSVAGVGPLYWVRYRVTAFNNITTQPKGTQAWWERLI